MRRVNFSLLALAITALALTGCGQSAKDGDTAPASDGKKPDAPASATTTAPASEAGPPAGAKVDFTFPQNNSKVFPEFMVIFAADKMQVVPAGEDVMNKAKGHHHIIVDGGPIAKGQVVPKDATHLHYGKGQKTAMMKLTPGKHTLTMQFADGNHISYGKALSKTVNVEVVPAPAKPPKVYFVEPADGAKVTSPVKLVFGLDGMTISPAGQNIPDKTMGHHHVIVDAPVVPAGVMVPADAKHIHFGKGQTEATLELPKGEHTLTLTLADGVHMSYGEALSHKITVTVE